MGEASLTVKAKGQDSARSTHIHAIRFEACGITVGVSGHNLCRCRRLLEFMRVGIIAERFDIGELFLALEVLIERLEGQGAFRCASPRVYPLSSPISQNTLIL